MAQRHIIATTNHPVCRLNLLLGIERKQRRDSVSTIERGLKKRKKRWTLERRGGGIFSAGRILLTLAFGKDFYSFYKAFSVPPSPNWAAHGGHLPYTFCLLPTPPTGSIVPTPLSREMPPVFYCKLPSDHLFLSSVTARQPSFASPMGPVFSPSIVMPVVKNSDPIVDFPFFLSFFFFFYSLTSFTSLFLLSIALCWPSSDEMLFSLRFSSEKLRPRYILDYKQLPYSIYIDSLSLSLSSVSSLIISQSFRLLALFFFIYFIFILLRLFSILRHSACYTRGWWSI